MVYCLMTPRSSSFLTRAYTEGALSPTACARSVYERRPSSASSVRRRRSMASIATGPADDEDADVGDDEGAAPPRSADRWSASPADAEERAVGWRGTATQPLSESRKAPGQGAS